VEWQLIKPLIPPPERGGGKRTVNMGAAADPSGRHKCRWPCRS
jgi:hypothetical protein